MAREPSARFDVACSSLVEGHHDPPCFGHRRRRGHCVCQGNSPLVRLADCTALTPIAIAAMGDAIALGASDDLLERAVENSVQTIEYLRLLPEQPLQILYPFEIADDDSASIADPLDRGRHQNVAFSDQQFGRLNEALTEKPPICPCLAMWRCNPARSRPAGSW